jgi:hypothetical protein
MRVSWTRGVLTALLILGSIALAAGLRSRIWPAARRQLHNYDLCFSLKTHATGFDIVVPGDSRVYRGVSPSAMRRVLPSARILNLGYSSGGLADPLLARAEDALAADSPVRAILVGITPFSLTEEAAENAHIRQYLQSSQSNERLRQAMAVMGAFDPLIDAPVPGLQGSQGEQRFYQDGWVASHASFVDHQEGLKLYREHYARVQVSSEVLQRFTAQVAKWCSGGIRVYGFRPPTCAAMVALEDEASGFDEAAVRAAFTAAGGSWIELPAGDYVCYDGSHLDAKSAAELSLALARAIAADL